MDPSHRSTVPVEAAVITVSTTRNRETDLSGAEIRMLLENASIPVRYYTIVKDEMTFIRREVLQALAVSNCVVVNGGTGLTVDDCTIEAVMPLFDRRIEGFGELFRMLSYQDIGTASMLSRATAGTIGKAVIFCIPGSKGAVHLAVTKLILPEARHILTHTGKETTT